jgi:hypothetical protein
MKKLLAFVLVLGIASMANAASCELYLLINGSSTYNPASGLTPTVDLYIDVDASSIYDADDASGGMDFVKSVTTGTITLSVGDWIPGSSTESVGSISSGDIVDAYWYKAGGADDHPANTIIYSFSITLSSDATGTISPFMSSNDRVVKGLLTHAYNENTYTPVTIVPEPMTIMLLGLGGLFLRRRK